MDFEDMKAKIEQELCMIDDERKTLKLCYDNEIEALKEKERKLKRVLKTL